MPKIRLQEKRVCSLGRRTVFLAFGMMIRYGRVLGGRVDDARSYYVKRRFWHIPVGTTMRAGLWWAPRASYIRNVAHMLKRGFVPGHDINLTYDQINRVLAARRTGPAAVAMAVPERAHAKLHY